jgi:hypothetical protein
MSTGSAWEDLQEFLGEEPSELAFRAVCSVLGTWPGDNREALAFAARELESWPTPCRRPAAPMRRSRVTVVRAGNTFGATG